jgi:hypothetical protein
MLRIITNKKPPFEAAFLCQKKTNMRLKRPTCLKQSLSADVTYHKLVEKLAEIGVEEKKVNIL